MGIKQYLEQVAGFNLRERFNVYAGMIMGTLAPILFFRYAILQNHRGDWTGEAVSWSGSLLINLIPAIVKPHIPIPVYGACAGAVVGQLEALRLQKNRLKRKEESQLSELTNQTA